VLIMWGRTPRGSCCFVPNTCSSPPQRAIS
jgi:hypothetical protein